MIKVYQVSRRYIMLFMHNNKYLPLTGLLTLLQWTIYNTAWNFWNISEIFHGNISGKNISRNFTSLVVIAAAAAAAALVIQYNVAQHCMHKWPATNKYGINVRKK